MIKRLKFRIPDTDSQLINAIFHVELYCWRCSIFILYCVFLWQRDYSYTLKFLPPHSLGSHLMSWLVQDCRTQYLQVSNCWASSSSRIWMSCIPKVTWIGWVEFIVGLTTLLELWSSVLSRSASLLPDAPRVDMDIKKRRKNARLNSVIPTTVLVPCVRVSSNPHWAAVLISIQYFYAAPLRFFY